MAKFTLKKALPLLTLGLIASPFTNDVLAQSFGDSNHSPVVYNPAEYEADFITKYSKKLRVELDSCCNKKLIAAAASWLGTPYRAGGNSKRGTDCSGFVSTLYREVFGVHLTHGGASMLAQMKQVIRKGMPLREGDILFFRTHGKRITHVGMYLKDNKFIHAATQGRGVVIDDLRQAYFRNALLISGSPFPKDMILSAK